jgi:hypothetical protein
MVAIAKLMFGRGAVRKATVICLAAVQLCLSLPSYAGPPCAPRQNFSALDISGQVNDNFLKHIKAIGLSTVIRYYDWSNETLPGKTLTSTELMLLKNNGLNVAVVFQHHNDSTSTFETSGRGTTDANRSLDLANAFHQAPGSAIYFGVDGVDAKFSARPRPGPDKFGIGLIKRYFDEVGATFRASAKNRGYAIGVYGSGLVCREILDGNLARHCWLANATSWPEYEAFDGSRRWSLKQSLPTKGCFGEEVDLNVVNPRFDHFGQWTP